MKINQSQKFTEFFEKQNSVRKVDFLVLHHVEANSVEHAIAQFREHQVSAHFLIDEAGEIFELVGENDIAFHAGVSFWKGCEGLNKNSIGVEFINASPFSKKFEMTQMLAGAALCRHLIAKHNIAAGNIVGHSDIGYNKESGCLDRKQDPSHLFDWGFLAEQGVGFFPKISLKNSEEKKLFAAGEKDLEIKKIKENLQKLGYRVVNLNEEFDLEMQALVRVFNRRFNPEKFQKNSDIWYLSSELLCRSLNCFFN